MKHRNTLLASLAIGSLTLSSCTTVNPYTGEQQVSKTSRNAAIGAIGGGILGAVIGNNTGSGDSRKGAIIGALGGAAIGAGIGQYMDRQEAQIRQQLEGSGVSVSRVGNDLVLNMPSDITFQTGQSGIQSQFASTLSSVALVLKNYSKTRISIAGHTDSDGSHRYNQNLSVQRAESVAYHLNSHGVPGPRLLTYGFGESRPIAANSSANGKALNRRVELRIMPQQSQF